MLQPPNTSLRESLQRLAGYLNFSAGVSDPLTLAAWNEAYRHATHENPLSGPPGWLVLKDWLIETLAHLHQTAPAFRDVTQARNVVQWLWSELLPAYLDFHRDLLFHQEPELLFNGFFLARCAEALLLESAVAEKESLIQRTITRLNDFVGYRPVAILENRRCEPYPHEAVRPMPLYIRGAGVTAGPYQHVVSLTLEILQHTDAGLMRAAGFEFSKLEELSLDVRAYDFDHPVNRRPNYHFGQWDERSVAGDGYYHRFVIRQVMLDALLGRITDHPEINRSELLAEAATVLAGTMLMASGVSGWGPAAHSSDVTLGSLMKPIAEYRDSFYQDALDRITGDHAKRLRDEQQLRRQPFGAARQHLNASLAFRRAAQLQHVQLSRLYARMGYPEAAKKQADAVTAPSARLMVRIDSALTLGLRALRAGNLDEALKAPRDTLDLFERAIHCGALVDPWDILGFGGNFSLFPSPEASVHDTRVDEIVHLIEQLFIYTARVWSEAAARDDETAYLTMEGVFREIADWWRAFAAHTVASLEAADPQDSFDSARLVARALRLWHRGGAAAGDVGFWAPHAELFDSPRAYSLVISALLEREDFVSAMALIVHWLGNADRVGLRQSCFSLPQLAERWLLQLRSTCDRDRCIYGEPTLSQSPTNGTSTVWPLAKKFFDYLEANAEEFWSAPTFRLGDNAPEKRNWELEITAADDEPATPSHGLFEAAYEGMTYRDTTDDGNDGPVFEFSDAGSLDELDAESKRLTEHLNFLQSLSRMWCVAADMAVIADAPDGSTSASARQQRVETLDGWVRRTLENRIGLLELLDAVRNYQVKPSGSDKESMRNYDRRRVLRDSLLERIIGTAVEMSDARRLISGALLAHSNDTTAPCDASDELAEDDACAIRLYASLISGNAEQARKTFPAFLEAIADKSLLYIPLSKGGDPVKIYVARLRQHVLRHLMHWLPRRGLIAETCRLVEVAREMEQQNIVGIGAVTEFDSLFRTAFRSLVASIVESVRQQVPTKNTPRERDRCLSDQLIPLLERLTESLLASWLAHSQTLRLSPLEMVTDPTKWGRLVEFITQYGDPIFTQNYLQLSNVRAILHQGVDQWLTRGLEEQEGQLADTNLFRALESGKLKLADAKRWISLVYEAILEHHAEYLDYNSTTTQSDRGELTYMFLDFLRLRARYERIAWNLKPVMWAHEVLVRSGLDHTATRWRRSLSDRIGAEAELYVTKLRQLQSDYAMRMPTVADHILERFIQPMTIDRMRALVAPAMRDAESNHPSRAFDLLEQEAELLTRHPTGVGIDVPVWLSSLEEEVELLAKRRNSTAIDPQSLMLMSNLRLSIEQIKQQLSIARSQGRRLPHIP
jgi:hypothetical protein